MSKLENAKNCMNLSLEQSEQSKDADQLNSTHGTVAPQTAKRRKRHTKS